MRGRGENPPRGRLGEVRYGIEGRWRRITLKVYLACGNDTFGDPAPDTLKLCQRRSVEVPLLTAAVTPIASHLDTAQLVGSGYEWDGGFLPSSGRPDVVDGSGDRHRGSAQF